MNNFFDELLELLKRGENFLSDVQILSKSNEPEPSVEILYAAVFKVLSQIAEKISKPVKTHSGTTDFHEQKISETFHDKVVNYSEVREGGIGESQNEINLTVGLLTTTTTARARKKILLRSSAVELRSSKKFTTKFISSATSARLQFIPSTTAHVSSRIIFSSCVRKMLTVLNSGKFLSSRRENI